MSEAKDPPRTADADQRRKKLPPKNKPDSLKLARFVKRILGVPKAK